MSATALRSFPHLIDRDDACYHLNDAERLS
jgi:hypothetical protein